MLTYKKNEPLQKLRDLVFSYFIAHPKEAEDFKVELNNLREAEDFYDFVIPTIRHKSFDTSAVIKPSNEKGFILVNWKGKDLYIKSNDEVWVRDYYIPSLKIEQLPGSPHEYTSYKKSGKILIDCGTAEGFFALENIDGFDKVYLIDGDIRWIDSIEKTFSPYKNKTSIIKNFITEETFNSMECLNTPQSDSVIKLDIEGYEASILSQLLNIQKSANNIEILVCCYHRHSDFNHFMQLADYYGFKVSVNPGWMLFAYDNLDPPFFRKGVIKIYK